MNEFAAECFKALAELPDMTGTVADIAARLHVRADKVGLAIWPWKFAVYVPVGSKEVQRFVKGRRQGRGHLRILKLRCPEIADMTVSQVMKYPDPYWGGAYRHARH